MYELKGKVALVTGAGGEHGIGRAIATRFAAEGADVVVNDVVAQPYHDTPTGWKGLSSVVQEIEGMGRQALGLVADVSNSHGVKAMVNQALERFGHIDILVNNAGTRAGHDRVLVVDLDEADWDRVQRVNAKGTFLCCQAVARTMIDHGKGGKVINMASTSGKQGTARYAAYCASKFAVVGFTQALAHELAPYRINVNAICPGLTETERVAHIAEATKPDGVSTEEYRALMVERTNSTVPLGRIAQPSDIAKMAAFLASSESDYMTGLALTISGGAMMR